MLAAVCKLHYWKIPHMSLFYSLVVILSFLALCELRLLWSFVGVRRGNYGWTAFLNLYARLWRIAAGLLSMAVIFNSVRPRKRSHTTLLKKKKNNRKLFADPVKVSGLSSPGSRWIWSLSWEHWEWGGNTAWIRWQNITGHIQEHLSVTNPQACFWEEGGNRRARWKPMREHVRWRRYLLHHQNNN